MDFLEKVDGVDKYKLYTGSFEEAIHTIKSDGRAPMTIGQIARKRVDVHSDRDNNSGEVWWWHELPFSVYNGVAYFDNKIKVIDGDTLIMATLEGERNKYTLKISEELYNALEGKEFKKSESYNRSDNSFLKAMFGDVFDEYKEVAEYKYAFSRGDSCVLPTFNDGLEFWRPRIPEVRGLAISSLRGVSIVYPVYLYTKGNFIGEILDE